MAFSLRLFKRDGEDRGDGKTVGDEGTVSDILLQTILRGDRISKDQALSIPAVESNVDFLSSMVASMPVKLYKKKKKDDGDGYIVEEVENDTRVRLLNLDTGDTLDAYQFKKALVADYLLDKGGYAYIKKIGNEVDGLYYIDPVYVSYIYTEAPIFKSYKFFVGGNEYQPFELIKLLRNTKTGCYGVGIIEELNDALDTALRTQLYQLGLVKTGGNKRGFLKSERRLGNEEITLLKKAWANLYANNTESVVVLNQGIDFKEASNTSVEMQLNESIKTLGDQIDKIFHITDDFFDTFKFAIYPILRAFETALNCTLLLEKEKGKYFFSFDVKEILRATPKERYEAYRIAKECGFMTKNEMRQREDMNEIEGLDVIDMGLGAVLYNVKTQTYYTPNTGSKEDLKKLEEESIIDNNNLTEV